jgi:hypothetical protein
MAGISATIVCLAILATGVALFHAGTKADSWEFWTVMVSIFLIVGFTGEATR